MLERMQFLHPHLEDGAAPALMAGAMSQAQETAAPQEADSAPSAQERFDELIRGEFKDAYQAKMQAALDRRFKQARATEERMKALEPVAKALSEHYGVSESELPRAMERAAAQRAARAGQRRADVARQMEETKGAYPQFDLAAEMRNPRFAAIARAGVDIKTAYEIAHKDELLSSAMAYAAQRAAKETAENIRARAGRPVENGAQAQAPAQPREKTVSEMTREEREDLARRAMRGERIVL